MRLETTNRNSTKVWMADDELEDLRRAAGSRRDDIIIQLGGYLGSPELVDTLEDEVQALSLRTFETALLTLAHL